MILFRKSIFLIPIREYWYEIQGGLVQSLLFSVYFKIIDKQSLPKMALPFGGKSIVVDLNQPIERIFGSFSKPTRNCIHQAEKLNFVVDFSVPPGEFVEFYNLFAKEKKLRRLSLREFDCLEDNYRICKVQLGEQVLAMHFYIMHTATAEVQLFKSASARLFSSTVNSSMIGKANKYLHFSAMIFFKDLSFGNYDFGGFSTSADPDYDKYLGINQFKKSFGGKEIAYVNYASIPYFILRFFQKKWAFKKQVNTCV